MGNKSRRPPPARIRKFRLVPLPPLSLPLEEFEQGLFSLGVFGADAAVGSQWRGDQAPAHHPIRNHEDRSNRDDPPIASSVNILGLVIKGFFHNPLPRHLLEKGPRAMLQHEPIPPLPILTLKHAH